MDDDLQCNTSKDQCLVDKNRLGGVVYAAYNCGIVCGVGELSGTESLTQVYIFLDGCST